MTCNCWCCVYSNAHDIHYRLRCVLLLPEHVPLARDLHLHRLPLNPIGLQPGWRKLHWEIDWLNPLIILISQSLSDFVFGSLLCQTVLERIHIEKSSIYRMKFKSNLRFYLRSGNCSRFSYYLQKTETKHLGISLSILIVKQIKGHLFVTSS